MNNKYVHNRGYGDLLHSGLDPVSLENVLLYATLYVLLLKTKRSVTWHAWLYHSRCNIISGITIQIHCLVFLTSRISVFQHPNIIVHLMTIGLSSCTGFVQCSALAAQHWFLCYESMFWSQCLLFSPMWLATFQNMHYHCWAKFRPCFQDRLHRYKPCRTATSTICSIPFGINFFHFSPFIPQIDCIRIKIQLFCFQ